MTLKRPKTKIEAPSWCVRRRLRCAAQCARSLVAADDFYFDARRVLSRKSLFNTAVRPLPLVNRHLPLTRPSCALVRHTLAEECAQRAAATVGRGGEVLNISRGFTALYSECGRLQAVVGVVPLVVDNHIRVLRLGPQDEAEAGETQQLRRALAQ
jgi:hypothetical protein